MIEFNPGDKVRVNEGDLEGLTGTVVDIKGDRTLVKLDGVTFAEGDLAFFDQVLVPASEEHEALTAVKLYPDLLKGGYHFRLTTFMNGIMYQSLPVDGPLLLDLLKNPPAGLYAVESKLNRSDTPAGVSWKLLWTES